MRERKEYAVFLYGEFNIQALCQLASSLRQGAACTCDLEQRPSSGSFNWAVTLCFEDGVQWVMRSPRNPSSELSIGVSLKLLKSEAVTLRYITANSDIPVPYVYHYSASFDNSIGIPYILMSMAPGWPLSQTWKSAGSESLAQASHKAKVLSQLGAITFKLSELRFPQIGSLFEHHGVINVKECLSRGHVLHQRYSLEELSRGPFTSENEFYDSLISAFVQHAEILQLLPHCFSAPIPCPRDYEAYGQYKKACDLWNDFVTVGEKIDSSDNRLDYMIAGNALHDIIGRLDKPTAIPDSYPLYHPDLSVNNIYVDDDYNITCIIDWAFSSSVPECVLLSPPGLPQSRNELSQDLINAFAAGFQYAMFSHPQVDGELRRRYRELMRKSRHSWLLTRLLNFDSIKDYNLFVPL